MRCVLRTRPGMFFCYLRRRSIGATKKTIGSAVEAISLQKPCFVGLRML